MNLGGKKTYFEPHFHIDGRNPLQSPDSIPGPQTDRRLSGLTSGIFD